MSDRGLALSERRDVDAGVLVVRRDVHDALDVGLLLEHLPVVLVGTDAARPIRLLVVPLHDLPSDFPTPVDARVALAPGRLLEEPANPGAVSPFLPVDVVLAVLVRIDDGDELEILPGHEPRVHLALSLHPAADLGEDDHVAGRQMAAPSQHATRNDGQRRGGGKAPQKPAAARLLHVPHLFKRAPRGSRRSGSASPRRARPPPPTPWRSNRDSRRPSRWRMPS